MSESAHMTAADLLDLVADVIACKPVLHLLQGTTYDGGLGEADHDTTTVMFDLQTDPGQERPIVDAEVKDRLIGQMTRLMQLNGAPAEYFDRLNLAH